MFSMSIINYLLTTGFYDTPSPSILVMPLFKVPLALLHLRVTDLTLVFIVTIAWDGIHKILDNILFHGWLSSTMISPAELPFEYCPEAVWTANTMYHFSSVYCRQTEACFHWCLQLFCGLVEEMGKGPKHEFDWYVISHKNGKWNENNILP